MTTDYKNGRGLTYYWPIYLILADAQLESGSLLTFDNYTFEQSFEWNCLNKILNWFYVCAAILFCSTEVVVKEKYLCSTDFSFSNQPAWKISQRSRGEQICKLSSKSPGAFTVNVQMCMEWRLFLLINLVCCFPATWQHCKYIQMHVIPTMICRQSSRRLHHHSWCAVKKTLPFSNISFFL